MSVPFSLRTDMLTCDAAAYFTVFVARGAALAGILLTVPTRHTVGMP